MMKIFVHNQVLRFALFPRVVSRHLARNVIKKPSSKAITNQKSGNLQAPPPIEDPWKAITDKATGQIYYWNTETNETTALGQPKPNSPSLLNNQQPAGTTMGSLGSVMAEGFAFGVGSSIARNVVGNLFGGSSDTSSSAGSGDDGDTWDV